MSERTISTDAPEQSDSNWPARVRVRHLTEADLPALEWDGKYRHFRRMYWQVYRRMQEGLAVMWGADLPGTGLIGQVFVQLRARKRPTLLKGPREAYVHSFRVKPAYRRAGVGTRLMEAVEQDLMRRGFHIVRLNVSRENQGALRLYQRLGYQIVGKDAGRWAYRDERGIERRIHDPGWQMRKRIDS